MSFKCPGCGRPLYNRRRATCEFCSAHIPAALLLSTDQRARVDEMKQAEQNRHRDVMSRDLPGGDGSAGGDFGGGCDSGGGDG